MKVEQRDDGSSSYEIYAPAIVLIFEVEASKPTCVWPQDTSQLVRILDGLEAETRDMLLAWLGVELPT